MPPSSRVGAESSRVSAEVRRRRPVCRSSHNGLSGKSDGERADPGRPTPPSIGRDAANTTVCLCALSWTQHSSLPPSGTERYRSDELQTTRAAPTTSYLAQHGAAKQRRSWQRCCFVTVLPSSSGRRQPVSALRVKVSTRRPVSAASAATAAGDTIPRVGSQGAVGVAATSSHRLPLASSGVIPVCHNAGSAPLRIMVPHNVRTDERRDCAWRRCH